MTKRQKKRMLTFAGAVIGILCLGMLFGTVYAQNPEGLKELLQTADSGDKGENVLPDIQEEETEKVPDTESETTELPEPENVERELPDDWNLILVNQDHLIPEDFEVELKEIGKGHQIDARAYDDYVAMVQAAREEGVYIYVVSSYRDMDKQIELHEKKIESYVMQGYSYVDAKKLAAQVVAIPGTSEHQLGLALDFVSAEYKRLDEKQEKTKGFQWLKEHCAEYGFILRYPNGKTDITGIIYEPWHFRYVGKEAAEVIMKAGITLEEYLGAVPPKETDEKKADTEGMLNT